MVKDKIEKKIKSNDEVLLKCLQPGMIFSRSYNPKFKVKFDTSPKSVNKEIAEYLLNNFSSVIKEVKEEG